MSFLELKRYRGFARLMVWVAKLVARWPDVASGLWRGHFTPADLWLRLRQEVAIAGGMSIDDAERMT